MYEAERRSRSYYEGRARWYDWANRIAALLRGVSQTRERRKAVERLALQPGHRVLEISVGTGTNAPLIAERIGAGGRLVGLDISRGMLERCRDKAAGVDLLEGEAAHLPLRTGAFDAVFHHGGFAEFGDKQGAVDEMLRVGRPSAMIVICDPGLRADRRQPLMSRLLLRLQPEYQQEPPLALVPPEAVDVQLSWFHGGAWYLMQFSKGA